MRGRPPKPTALKIAEGDARKIGMRKLQQKLDGEPKAQKGLPECPEHLVGCAASAWAFLSQELDAMGLASRCDAILLEGLCVQYARAAEADQQVRREGLLVEVSVTNREGTQNRKELRTNPAVSVSNAAWKLLRGFASDFGLNPVSRTRLTVERPDDDEDLEALLNAPRPKREIQ